MGRSFLRQVSDAFWTELCSFQCPRYINYVDWRLGLTHKSITLGITIYVLVMLFKEQTFLRREPPIAIFSSYASMVYDGEHGFSDYTQAQGDIAKRDTPFNKGVAGEPAPYCNNHQYDYVFNDQYSYENITCSYWDLDEVSHKGESQMFFTTLAQDTVVSKFKKDDDTKCTYSAFENRTLERYCPRGKQARIEERFGYCVCSTTSYEFPVAVENTTLTIMHYYSSTYRSGNSPLTVLRVAESTKDLLTFQPGEPWELPIWKLLEFAQVSLDERHFKSPFTNATQPVRAAERGGPYRRVSGLLIALKFSYYNYHEAPGDEAKRSGAEGNVKCVVEMTVRDTWTSMGSSMNYERFPLIHDIDGIGAYVDRYQYGIKVSLNAAGFIGSFDFMFLMNALVSGVVLIGVSVKLTEVITYYLLGDRSRLYTAMGRETASCEKEYARCLVQTIVAGHVFDNLGDHDDLSRSQLRKILSKSMKGMSEEQLTTLVELVMYEADMAAVAEGRLDEDAVNTTGGKLSKDMWDSLFAPSRASIEGIKQTVDSMTEEEREFFRLRSIGAAPSLTKPSGTPSLTNLMTSVCGGGKEETDGKSEAKGLSQIVYRGVSQEDGMSDYGATKAKV